MYTSRYQIVISGRLGVAGREAFRDFHVKPHGMASALAGDPNRVDLFDVLARMRDLAPDLIGLTCLAPEPDIRLAQ
jgi:hypothetical protein